MLFLPVILKHALVIMSCQRRDPIQLVFMGASQISRYSPYPSFPSLVLINYPPPTASVLSLWGPISIFSASINSHCCIPVYQSTATCVYFALSMLSPYCLNIHWCYVTCVLDDRSLCLWEEPLPSPTIYLQLSIPQSMHVLSLPADLPLINEEPVLSSDLWLYEKIIFKPSYFLCAGNLLMGLTSMFQWLIWYYIPVLAVYRQTLFILLWLLMLALCNQSSPSCVEHNGCDHTLYVECLLFHFISSIRHIFHRVITTWLRPEFQLLYTIVSCISVLCNLPLPFVLTLLLDFTQDNSSWALLLTWWIQIYFPFIGKYWYPRAAVCVAAFIDLCVFIHSWCIYLWIIVWFVNQQVPRSMWCLSSSCGIIQHHCAYLYV